MRNYISIVFLIIITLGALINNAEAKRFGGGKSFGYQRSATSYSRPRESVIPPAAAAAQPARSGMSRWLGPLAGLAAGGLLASLFMGHGIGGGLLSWLAIAGIGFMIWNLIRSRMQPAVQTPAASFHENSMQNNVSQFTPNTSDSSSVNHMPLYPAGFDPETFLREAKVQFIRLQAAYDSKNLADLREFTAPEVFAEIQLQLQERGDEANHTDVVKLEAELLDVGIESQGTVASVRFSGSIREEANGVAAPFTEVWHLRKYSANPNWVIAGLQQ